MTEFGAGNTDQIEANKLEFERSMKLLDNAYQSQAAQGRWIIGSLLIIHGGVFGFVIQNEQASTVILDDIFWHSVWGIVLALICGFSTWWNWSFAAARYFSYRAIDVFQNAPVVPTQPYDKILSATTLIAIGTGLLSVGLLLVIAVVTACNLHQLVN